MKQEQRHCGGCVEPTECGELQRQTGVFVQLLPPSGGVLIPHGGVNLNRPPAGCSGIRGPAHFWKPSGSSAFMWPQNRNNGFFWWACLIVEFHIFSQDENKSVLSDNPDQRREYYTLATPNQTLKDFYWTKQFITFIRKIRQKNFSSF